MSEWKIRFGTAGISDSFTVMGYKNSLDIPAYTEKMGLDAFEYQCGHGVRLGLDKALPPLRCDLFAVPFRRGDQLGLF